MITSIKALRLAGLLLASQQAINALPLAEQRDISQDLFNQLSFFEQYSAAAYCSNNNDPGSDPQISCESGNCPSVEGANSTTITEFRDGGKVDATGFVAIDPTNKLVVVSYRGSRSVVNFLADANLIQEPFLCSDCWVHAGFLDSWMATKDTVVNAIGSALQANPDYGVVVTGHSLGGAMATLAASELRTLGHNVALYTYGSPMVGNHVYAQFVTDQPGGNFRITHQADAVPKLPGYEILNYRHVSPQYWISTDNGVTPTATDIQESQGILDFSGNWNDFGFSVSNHLWYFNAIASCTMDQFEITK